MTIEPGEGLRVLALRVIYVWNTTSPDWSNGISKQSDVAIIDGR